MDESVEYSSALDALIIIRPKTQFDLQCAMKENIFGDDYPKLYLIFIIDFCSLYLFLFAKQILATLSGLNVTPKFNARRFNWLTV